MDEKQGKKEHIRLASVVKSVHADLRKKLRSHNGDYETVWHQHCQDQTLLSTYAECMQKLAQEHWTKRSQNRIDWCRHVINEYFLDGGLKKVLQKELKKQAFEENRKQSSSMTADYSKNGFTAGGTKTEIAQASPGCRLDNCSPCDIDSNKGNLDNTSITHICFQETLYSSAKSSSGPQTQTCCSVSHEKDDKDCNYELMLERSNPSSPDIYTEVRLPFEDKIRLLDVGSCYNPFLQFSEFMAIGIDISPAHESVHYCDFLHLETTDPLQVAPDTLSTYLGSLRSPIHRLPRCSFHTVVFSLLLEYLPSPYQRWLCCTKAHELLQHNGLLVIVTPDSHSQHRNAPMMRSWKKAIESMGFSRWRYVKDEHLHCMAFRKTRPAAPASLLVDDVTPDLLYIPQDLADAAQERAAERSRDPFLQDECEAQEFFQRTWAELPAFVPEDCGEPLFYFSDNS